MKEPAALDGWAQLRAATPARIGLPRAGQSLALSEVLAFQYAHALARDAVHAALDVATLMQHLGETAAGAVVVESAAGNRQTYLRRPDLGRRLSERAWLELSVLKRADPFDLAIVIADGLSAVAVQHNAPALVRGLGAVALRAGWCTAPLIIATQARVALGDHVATAVGARMVVVLIGERPGLSANDSLGAYFTFAPKAGSSTDADRNCISNIRDGGLGGEQALHRLVWLITEADKLGRGGVALKDDSGLMPTRIATALTIPPKI